MPGIWTVAPDFKDRIKALRDHLGEDQPTFAKRFGRRKKQISSWENGHQRPRTSTLEWAAEKNGWPLEIFEDGKDWTADTLADLVKVPVNASDDDGAPAVTGTPERPSRRHGESGAADVGVLRPERAADRETAKVWERIQKEIAPYLMSGEPLDAEQAQRWLTDMLKARRG